MFKIHEFKNLILKGYIKFDIKALYSEILHEQQKKS